MEEIERLLSLLEQPSEHHPVSVPSEVPSVPFSSNQPKEKFLSNVQASKKYITAGDIIQVVGSQRFSVNTQASPVDVYRAARSVNPSPYMFLLELDGFSLVGASPEIHVRCEDHKVEIRPIAGTRRRGKTADEDAAKDIGDQIQTGTVYMNRADYLDPALAWAGVKESGRGVTLSRVGYEHLTRPKSFHLRTKTA